MPLTRARKTLPALHWLKKLPQSLHSPPDITPHPPIKQQICEQQNRINILEAPHEPGAPGSPLSVSLGRLITPQLGWHTGVWRSCCSSWSRSKPQFLREEHTAWPVNTSIQSALSLAGTSVHNNRTLSPKLLSYTRVAKSNTWNYCPGKD